MSPGIRRGLSVLLTVLAGVLIAPVSRGAEPAAASKPSTPAEIVASLERGDRDDTIYLYDMHGNANDSLQQLMVFRFAATDVVMKSIDRMEGDAKRAGLRAALFGVLGFVKDPASIEWLQAKRRADAEAFYRDYVPAWSNNLDGYGSWPWLTGRDRWIAFWREAFDEDTSAAHRIALLNVLCQFDDPGIVSFFQARRSVARDPKEVLFVETYLDELGVPADEKRVQWAVDALARAPKDRNFVVSMARSLRSKAFVPFLVEISDVRDPNAIPAYYPAERALQAITYQCDMHGKVEWQRWYAAHGQEERREWTKQTLDAFREKLAKDPAAAAKEFDHSVYCWNEISLLPLVETELMPHPELHDNIAGWINLTYSDVLRERLRPLAERVGNGGHLQDWSRRLLQERGYLPGLPKPTWAETVENANTRL